jgi:hypothetical protein
MLNGRGERSSAAHSAVSGRPRARRCAAIASNPCVTGTGRRQRARSITWPGSAATPCEYGKPPCWKA